MKSSTIKAEIDKLRSSRFTHPIAHTAWVSNIIPMTKKKGTINICTDFHDLNKACTKDNYPMTFIGRLIDTCVGLEVLSFMYDFSSYNQI